MAEARAIERELLGAKEVREECRNEVDDKSSSIRKEKK